MTLSVLYVEGCRDGSVGGSHTALYSLVANLDRQQVRPVVVFYDEHYIAAKMRAIGVDVHVVEKRNPLNLGERLERLSAGAGKWGVVLLPLQKLANFAWFFLRPALSGTAFLRRHGIRLVHLNNSINGNHEWMLAALLAGVPFVSHERGISERLSRTSRWLAGAAGALVCMSNAIRDPLVRQGVSADKAVVIYDGVDTGRIKQTTAASDIRALHGIAPADPVIGVVGNVKRWKGQETVVRATAILKASWPTVRCLVVGDHSVDPGYYDSLRRMVDELSIGDNVVFTGYQNNPADYVAAMDVVVHSSLQPEPFGMVNLEAMYLGKPVVATNMGGPTEIFDHGNDGILIEPADPPLLARHLASLIESPELRRRLGENARRSVMRRFTVAQTMRELGCLYQTVLTP